MANRSTRFLLKNSITSGSTLPITALKGEPLVNLYEGIMYFSGVSGGDFTTGNTNTDFFEVGSKLTNLKIKGRLTEYESVSGSGLVGKFLSGTTDGFVLANVSSITGVDTYVTGFTYDDANTLTISQNQGQSPLYATINNVTGLTINGDLSVTGNSNLNLVTATTINSNNLYVDTTAVINNLTVTGTTSLSGITGDSLTISSLGSNRVVYTTSGGLLTTESNFTYDEGTDTMVVNNIEASGNVVIQGDLTVFGSSISAFTTNLYVEDPNITLNYNPTGSTTITSVNSGFVIQDGSGVSGNSVNWDIVRMQNLTGLTSGETPSVVEYTSGDGYTNRGWITQLNDIVIRSTDPIDDNTSGSINGVRVLGEFDVLDGGSYS